MNNYNKDTGANYRSNNNSYYSDNEYNASEYYDRETRNPYKERAVIKRRNTMNTVIMAFAVLAVTVMIAVTAYVMGSYNSDKKSDSQEQDNVAVQQTEETAQNESEEQAEEQAQSEEEVQKDKAPQTENSTPPANQPVAIMYVTARDFLALKSGPGINYKRIYKIPPGAAVEVLEPISGEFVKARYSGMEGYVAARYLSSSAPSSTPVSTPASNPAGTMYVTARDFLALKSGPGINYKRIYKIPPGAAVEVLEPLGAEFVKARYSGMEGYVAAKYLSYSQPQPQPQQPSTIMYVTARDFLALKSGPGINYERIYKIPPRAAVELLEPISGEFVKVSYNGMVGYVAARYLSY